MEKHKSDKKLEGEGSYSATRKYNADARRFAADKARVSDAARKAKEAMEGDERESLERAARIGKKGRA